MTDSALATSLRSIFDALELPIGENQVGCLLSYLTLLQRWNATYNLTSVREPAQMLTQHLADCLAIVPPLLRQIGRAESRLLDVGSGGGLPGLVIAAMLPHVEVTCVDSVGKKVAFVRQAAGELRLPNLHAQHCRIEQLDAKMLYGVIVSRAFAALPEFVRLTARLLAEGGCWLAMKGKRPSDEIAALPETAAVFHVEQLQVPGLASERCLVWLRPVTAQ